MKALLALLSGLLFGCGLSLGGMTQPAVVLGILDIFGHWDPRLALVMASAVLTTAIGYRLVLRRRRPLLADSFQVPASRRVDGRLIGALLIFVRCSQNAPSALRPACTRHISVARPPNSIRCRHWQSCRRFPALPGQSQGTDKSGAFSSILSRARELPSEAEGR